MKTPATPWGSWFNLPSHDGAKNQMRVSADGLYSERRRLDRHDRILSSDIRMWSEEIQDYVLFDSVVYPREET